MKLKRIAILLSVLLLIVVVAIGFSNREYFHKPAEDSIVKDDDWSEAAKVEAELNKEQPKTETNKETTEELPKTEAEKPKEVLFLLVGLDKNDESDGLNSKTRTDTIILTKLNFEKGTVDLINIPRDSRVLVNGNLDKINHAHAYGGMPLTLRTVGDFMDIDIDKYVKVSFESVQFIVNTLGGVEVELNETVAAAMGKPAGANILNGDEALYYLRFRKGYSNGDIGRIIAQQQFLLSLAKQSLRPDNLIKLPALYGTLKAYMDTNIDEASINDWISLASNLNSDSFSTNIVQGYSEYIGDIWYWIPDEDFVEGIVDEKLAEYKK
ncbi:MAG: LCP family protein [Tissierellia bacterium]|nr:LCP family protein [Tissierellia bacterium]